MAGNTKLMGFAPKVGIVLERWGEKTAVKVSEDSLEAIRHACIHVLPPHCPQREWELGDAIVDYDEVFGRVVIKMTPELAAELAEHLKKYKDVDMHSDLLHLPDALEREVKAHEDYIDEREPWVE